MLAVGKILIMQALNNTAEIPWQAISSNTTNPFVHNLTCLLAGGYKSSTVFIRYYINWKPQNPLWLHAGPHLGIIIKVFVVRHLRCLLLDLGLEDSAIGGGEKVKESKEVDWRWGNRKYSCEGTVNTLAFTSISTGTSTWTIFSTGTSLIFSTIFSTGTSFVTLISCSQQRVMGPSIIRQPGDRAESKTERWN